MKAVMNRNQQEFVEVVEIKPASEFQPKVEQRRERRITQPFVTPAPPQIRANTQDSAPPTDPKTNSDNFDAPPRVKPFVRPLRILHVTSDTGANPFINNLCDFTDRRVVNHLAATLGAEGEFTKALDQRGIQVYALNSPQRGGYPRAIYKLGQIIQRERIDIVHTHLFDPTMIGLLAARLRHRRLVVTRHYADQFYQMPAGYKRSVYLTLEEWIGRSADHFIAPTQMVRDILVRRERVPESKVSVIPYGQLLRRWSTLKPEGVEKLRAELKMQTRLAMVCVASLTREKGHRFLLEAFALLRDEGLDANLYLAGAGPEIELLEKLVKELELSDRVHLLGQRYPTLPLLAAADLVIQPALLETQPAAVIDALMLERPLVVTDVCGVRDLVGNSNHAILIPPRNVEALHAAIGWTANNLTQAKERALAGRQFLLEYLSPERVAREYFGVYRKVMKDYLSKVAAKKGRISADTRQMIEESE
jgi:glycosyltransferase involved in cell wall biosynthesis